MPEALLQRDNIDEVFPRDFKQSPVLFGGQRVGRMAEILARAGQFILILNHKGVELVGGHLLHIAQQVFELGVDAAHIKVIAAQGKLGPVGDFDRRVRGHGKVLAQGLDAVEKPRGVVGRELHHRPAQGQQVAFWLAHRAGGGEAAGRIKRIGPLHALNIRKDGLGCAQQAGVPRRLGEDDRGFPVNLRRAGQAGAALGLGNQVEFHRVLLSVKPRHAQASGRSRALWASR